MPQDMNSRPELNKTENLKIRLAFPPDLEQILKIYSSARAFMKSYGNGGQWGDTYPAEEIVRDDIEEGRCCVVCCGKEIHGVFALCTGDDETYASIDGAWLNDEPYITIHRAASDGKMRGIFDAIADYCKAISDNIRIDTHEKNAPMQRCIERNGFEKCGIIITHDGTPRIAYQWMKPAKYPHVIDTTLCYIEKDGKWLLLYRNSKPQDVNEGKWVGVGGKFEPGETADQCLLREVCEETGIRLKDYKFLGVVEFRPDDWPPENMHLYRASVTDADCPAGLTEPGFCSEGRFEWVPEDKIFELPMWTGDPYFLRPMLKGREKIDMRLDYEGDKVIRVTDYDKTFDISVFDGKFIKLESEMDETVWGVCEHSGEEYCYHEYGRMEECLMIARYLFYKSDIKSVRLAGPDAQAYGPDGTEEETEAEAIPPFDMIQEETLREGDIDFIEDALFEDDPRNVMRMLSCIDHYLEPGRGIEIPEREKIIALISALANSTDDEELRLRASEIYRRWTR